MLDTNKQPSFSLCSSVRVRVTFGIRRSISQLIWGREAGIHNELIHNEITPQTYIRTFRQFGVFNPPGITCIAGECGKRNFQSGRLDLDRQILPIDETEAKLERMCDLPSLSSCKNAIELMQVTSQGQGGFYTLTSSCNPSFTQRLAKSRRKQLRFSPLTLTGPVSFCAEAQAIKRKGGLNGAIRT